MEDINFHSYGDLSQCKVRYKSSTLYGDLNANTFLMKRASGYYEGSIIKITFTSTPLSYLPHDRLQSISLDANYDYSQPISASAKYLLRTHK